VPVQKLLTPLAGVAIWITRAIIPLAVVCDVPIAGCLTTSGIIIAVIGFGLRNYSQPNGYWRDDFEIVLPYDVTYR
jgi:hypothetical protein